VNAINTQPNAMPEPKLDSQVNAPAVIPPTQLMYWSVRRELWENRSLYIAPLAAAALFLVGFLISTVRLPEKMRAASALDPMQQLELIAQPYNFAALLLMGTTLLVAIFYCLDALYGERRDRSILFWKSLPVSDLTVVLSKASVPLLVLPIVTFVITIATQWIMLMLSSVVLLGSGVSVAPLWRQLPFVQMSLMLLFHLVLGHGLYYAPFYGWLLLVSGWARRATFLWATLPLFAIGIVEKIAFNTTHFATMLGSRFSGGAKGGDFPLTVSESMHPLSHLIPMRFLISPGLWIGLAVFALFLAAAVRIRRYQEPI
jgi:ABC-2 type transport system permease protein